MIIDELCSVPKGHLTHWLDGWLVTVKTRNQLLALCWLLCGGLSRRLLAVSMRWQLRHCLVQVCSLMLRAMVNTVCGLWCLNKRFDTAWHFRELVGDLMLVSNCVSPAGLAPHGPIRFVEKPKHFSGWFVVREKHCSGWKNKLKKTDYKRSEQGRNVLNSY